MSATLPRAVRNKEILLRSLEGQTPEAIAELYDLEPQTIKNIQNSPLVQQEMLRLQGEMGKDIVAKVKARSHEALETVTDTMRGEVSSELRFKAAKDLLDRNPDLQPEKDEALGAIGAGMGEWLVRELAKRRNEKDANESTDITPEGANQSSLQPPTDPSEG